MIDISLKKKKHPRKWNRRNNLCIAFLGQCYMVAYFCHHWSDLNTDLSYVYNDLSDLYVDLLRKTILNLQYRDTKALP